MQRKVNRGRALMFMMVIAALGAAGLSLAIPSGRWVMSGVDDCTPQNPICWDWVEDDGQFRVSCCTQSRDEPPGDNRLSCPSGFRHRHH